VKRFTRYTLLVTLFFASAASATTLQRGISEAIRAENPPYFEEIYQIKISNTAGGTIEVSNDLGWTWQPVGKVIYPTTRVSQAGFAAARWVGPGRVAATAVNAIHLKVGSAESERTIFSLLPREFQKAPNRYRSFLSPDSSIYTDIPAGTAIFGGGWAPFVGNSVMVAQPGLKLNSLPEYYRPQVGDIIYILVDRAIDNPKEMVLENRFGGRITLKYFSGVEKVIGEVLQPVQGVGRFEGSLYAGSGRIRANHPGVIDVAASATGALGGFQIVPALHGEDMGYVRERTQWMVIGPAEAEDPSLEGMAPFFKYFLQPNYRPDDIMAADWEAKLLDRFLVQVRFNGSDQWQPMPTFALRRDFPLPAWANNALAKVSHFRILFPISE
jgi:hypothetical protein